MAINFMKIRTGVSLKPNTAPGSPENGDIYYDSGTNQFGYYQNGAFVNYAANTLGNLTSVAINTTLLPASDNSIDIGSAAKRWANIHGLSHLIYGSTSGAITLQAANTTTSYTVKWPSAQGAASTVLTNDGSGNLSWAAAGTSGANTALSNLAAVAINTTLLPGTDNTIDLGSAAKRWSNVHSLNHLLYGSTSGAITLSAANTTTSYSVKFPAAQGAANTVLLNDGSGNLTWTASGGGFGVNVRAGSATVTNGTSSLAVVYSSTIGTTTYGLTANLRNTVDGSPQYQPLIITAKSATGFTASWNSPADSANYVVEYIALQNAFANFVTIGSAQTSIAVVFSTSMGTTNYAVNATLRNTVDGSPQYQPIIISAKSATGFTASWNAATDSANYILEYIAQPNA